MKYINLEDLSIRQYAKDDSKGFLKENSEGLILG
tara:strand:+ start:1216 stop:1317 length:102 start_codon:yes stop_codon:yes gene_type:complete